MKCSCGIENSLFQIEDGDTTLHLAAYEGHKECIHKLIEDGDDSCPDAIGRFPIHYAAEQGHVDCLEVLARHDEDVLVAGDHDEYTPLHLAAYAGNDGCVEQMLKHDSVLAEVNAASAYGYTALHYAVLSRSAKSVEALLARADLINVNSVNEDGNTPLHFAAHMTENSKSLKHLLNSKSIELDVRNSQGRTPLHFAAHKGNSMAVSLIYKKAQERDMMLLIPDNYSDTPLHMASRMGHKQCIINIVLKNFICKKESANFSLKNVDGATALEVALQRGHPECVQVLSMIH